MKIISTFVHGILDYAVGLLLIAAPFLLGFATGGPEQWVPIIAGVLTIGMSLLTAYELSIAKLIPLRLHLAMDGLVGLLLIVSPWLLGFADVVWIPHVFVGVIELIVVVLTRTSSMRRHTV